MQGSQGALRAEERAERAESRAAGASGLRATGGAGRAPLAEVRRMEGKLRAQMNRPISVVITDNRHTVVSLRRKEGQDEARLHHMFVGAPEWVVSALGRFFLDRDPMSSRLIDGYIREQKHLIQKRARAEKLLTRGSNVDLQEVFDDLNRRFFAGSVGAKITWGRRSRPVGGRRVTMKLGSYAVEEKLIRIHPVLDQAFVPRYFVEWVVYHEMLHHVVPIPVRGGRRCFHSDEFRARERLFPSCEEAERWEKENIGRLLASD